jgi:DNA-binding transcriptional LysR family regulator
MDLRDLRYFEAIADLEHMGRASSKLHRSQPALTSCVRRLEEDVGALLFEKSGRGIRLTPAGTVLLKWAQRMRFDVEDAKRELASIGEGLAGHIRIGIVPTAAQFLLPSVARELLHEAPEVTLKTVVGLVDTLKPLLRAGEIDMMVGTETPEESGYVSKVVAEDAIVVAASASHELLRGKPTLKDLTGYRWALQPPGAVRPQAPAETSGAGRSNDAADSAGPDRGNRIAQLHLPPPLGGASREIRPEGDPHQGCNHASPAGRELPGQQLFVSGGSAPHRAPWRCPQAMSVDKGRIGNRRGRGFAPRIFKVSASASPALRAIVITTHPSTSSPTDKS